MTAYANETVGRIAAQNPASVRVFEKLGIDYCCGGKLPLRESCEPADVPLEKVVALLQEIENNNPAGADRDWSQAAATELIEHIVGRHHAFVRREIPRLKNLLVEVNERHAASHPELAEIQELFEAAAEELQAHLFKEERVLFPHIEALETAARLQLPAPQGCFPSVEFPIARMLADHDDAGGLFASIRKLSSEYVAPAATGESYRAVYQGLKEFEQDLHRHIHLENNILFPRAIELERGVSAGS